MFAIMYTLLAMYFIAVLTLVMVAAIMAAIGV